MNLSYSGFPVESQSLLVVIPACPESALKNEHRQASMRDYKNRFRTSRNDTFSTPYLFTLPAEFPEEPTFKE